MRADEHRLANYLDDVADRLWMALPKALVDGDCSAIHNARVATRRLKAALDMLGPVLGEESTRPVARGLRRVRRSLGTLRDLDVMVGHLNEIPVAAGLSVVGWALERMRGIRQDELTRAGGERGVRRMRKWAGRWSALHGAIRRADPAIESLLTETVLSRFDDFSRRADALASTRVGRDERSTGAEAPTDDPHALRIAGKALRYTLEMAQVALGGRIGTVIRSFKRMQDALGLWHDHAVLTLQLTTMAGAAELAVHQPAMHAELLRLAQRMLARSRSHLARFVRLWSSRRAELEQLVRGQFVASVAITPRQTGPGPSGSPPPPGPAAVQPVEPPPA